MGDYRPCCRSLATSLTLVEMLFATGWTMEESELVEKRKYPLGCRQF